MLDGGVVVAINRGTARPSRRDVVDGTFKQTSLECPKGTRGEKDGKFEMKDYWQKSGR